MESTENKTPAVKRFTRIAIAGAGGIGGFVAQGLYDYGAIRRQFMFSEHEIDVYDIDVIDVSNLLHQNFSEDDLGKEKALLLADRYAMNSKLRFMTENDFSKYDLIFSCVDSMEFRAKLYRYGFAHPKLVWIDGRCTSRTISLYHSVLPDKQLEGTLTKSVERTGCLREVDKIKKISHITPQIIAGMMVQTFLNMIRGEDPSGAQELYI